MSNETRALGEDEGATCAVGVYSPHDEGAHRPCGKPLPCPDHPQSTKEVAVVAGGADRKPSDTDDGKEQHPAEGARAGGEAQSPITPAAAPAEPGASATPLQESVAQRIAAVTRAKADENTREMEEAMTDPAPRFDALCDRVQEAGGMPAGMLTAGSAPLPPAQPATHRCRKCGALYRQTNETRDPLTYEYLSKEHCDPACSTSDVLPVPAQPAGTRAVDLLRIGPGDYNGPHGPQEQLGKEGVGAAPPTADELGKLLDRAAPGADYLAASLRGQFPMRTESAGAAPEGLVLAGPADHEPSDTAGANVQAPSEGKQAGAEAGPPITSDPPSTTEKQDSTAGAAAVPEAGALAKLIDAGYAFQAVAKDTLRGSLTAMRELEAAAMRLPPRALSSRSGDAREPPKPNVVCEEHGHSHPSVACPKCFRRYGEWQAVQSGRPALRAALDRAAAAEKRLAAERRVDPATILEPYDAAPSGDARPDRFLEGWLAGREAAALIFDGDADETELQISDARHTLRKGLAKSLGDVAAAQRIDADRIRALAPPVAPSIPEEPKPFVAPAGTHPDTCPVPGSHTRTSCNYFREQLARYGHHQDGCTMTSDPTVCSCGFLQALAAKPLASTMVIG